MSVKSVGAVLVDHQILAAIKEHRIKIDPFDPELINPASLDIRLGKHFTKTKLKPPYTAINPLKKETFQDVTFERDHYTLNPNEFILASMYEQILLPPDVVAVVKGKSSLGRLGLDASCSVAGLLDPGFGFNTTLELKNIGPEAIELTHGMKIGQLMFFQTEKCTLPYGEKVTSRYFGQKPGQGSMGI